MSAFEPDDPDYFYPHAEIPTDEYREIHDAHGRAWRLSRSRAADSTSFRLWGWWRGDVWVFRTLAQIESTAGMSTANHNLARYIENQAFLADSRR